MVYLDSVLNVPVRTAVARAAVARRPSWSASSRSGRADSSTSCRTRTRRSCDVSSVHGPAGHRPRARPQPTRAPLRPTTSSSTRTRHKMRTGRRRAAATVPPPPVAETGMCVFRFAHWTGLSKPDGKWALQQFFRCALKKQQCMFPAMLSTCLVPSYRGYRPPDHRALALESSIWHPYSP